MDFFAILSTGGVILWLYAPVKDVDACKAIDSAIQRILREGTWLPGCVDDGPLRIEWTFARDEELIFMV